MKTRKLVFTDNRVGTFLLDVWYDSFHKLEPPVDPRMARIILAELTLTLVAISVVIGILIHLIA